LPSLVCTRNGTNGVLLSCLCISWGFTIKILAEPESTLNPFYVAGGSPKCALCAA
jgi:hypothetical protein